MSGRPSRRAAATRRAIVEESDSDDGVGDTTGIKKQEDDSEDEFSIVEPAPKPVRKSTAGRRKTAASVGTASSRSRARKPRKSAAPSSAEPSEILDADETATTIASSRAGDEEIEIAEPAKKPAPRKRKVATKVAASRKTRKSETPEVQQAAKKSQTPEVQQEAQQEAEVEQTPAPLEVTEIQQTPAAQISNPQLSLPTPQSNMPPDMSQSHAETLAEVPDNVNDEQPKPIVKDEPTATIKPIKAMDTILERPMDIVLKSRAQMTVPIVEETGPKFRTVIRNLILINFKSYAGRQEVGPFHASFSSVIGPNGSGKSNVIDSLLFVFGFRASKMRQGKVSALIHNSAQHPNLDHTEVAVHFQEVMDLVCFYSIIGISD